MGTIINILGLSLIASMGTGLGGLIAVLRKPGQRTFGFLMGFTAGVMITLSFLELVNEAWQSAGFLTATIGFGGGALFMFLIDFLTPHIRFAEEEIDGLGKQIQPDNDACPRQRRFGRHRRRRTRRPANIQDRRLYMTGILIAIGIAIHNTPEGIAVGAGYIYEPRFGLVIALAITLHNIPEGIATALPLFKSGLGQWAAFRTALFSGLTEPIGALLAALFLANYKALVPGALAFAGGVMTFITLDELIPCAREYGHQHFTAMGIITGAISVFLLSGIFQV